MLLSSWSRVDTFHVPKHCFISLAAILALRRNALTEFVRSVHAVINQAARIRADRSDRIRANSEWNRLKSCSFHRRCHRWKHRLIRNGYPIGDSFI